MEGMVRLGSSMSSGSGIGAGLWHQYLEVRREVAGEGPVVCWNGSSPRFALQRSLGG